MVIDSQQPWNIDPLTAPDLAPKKTVAAMPFTPGFSGFSQPGSGLGGSHEAMPSLSSNEWAAWNSRQQEIRQAQQQAAQKAAEQAALIFSIFRLGGA